MATWTDLADVESRHLPGVAVEARELVQQRLADVEQKLRRRVPGIDARIASGEVTAMEVQRVVAEAVIRLLLNPEGVTQRSVTEGPFSQAVSYAQAAAGNAGTITFPEDDLDDLRGGGASPVGVAHMSLPRWRVP